MLQKLVKISRNREKSADPFLYLILVVVEMVEVGVEMKVVDMEGLMEQQF